MMGVEKVEERKYLKFYQKVAYGSGDMGSNFMYTFVVTFLLIYLTDTVGLNAGIVGTLMMISKIFDGITDVIFGNILDKTKSKMGKARYWMFWSTFPLAICEILLFAFPTMSQNLQYIYFFIIYTALNSIFYTANNISYSSLTALSTKNPTERVQLGSFRFIFALIAAIFISSSTVNLVGTFGGGAAGWRNVAILYSLLMVLFNMIVVFFIKELPIEEEVEAEDQGNIIENIKILFKNRYYLLILAYYLVMYAVSGITQGIGVYFATYILGDASLLGLFSLAGMLPMIVGLTLTPILVKRWGIYKVNLIGLLLSTFFGIFTMIAGFAKAVPLLVIFTALKGLFSSPMTGTLNAVIADTAQYTFLKEGKRLEGTMYSSASVGIKVGGGLGSAIGGWLLTLGGYNGKLQVQPDGALKMISFMYLVIPFIASILMAIIASRLNVQKANYELEQIKGS